jgi:hypothetical protein
MDGWMDGWMDGSISMSFERFGRSPRAKMLNRSLHGAREEAVDLLTIWYESAIGSSISL